MGFFKKNTVDNDMGIQLLNLLPAERKNLIVLVDYKKKKKKGVMDSLVGIGTDTTSCSAITLELVTHHLRKIANIPENESINIFIHTLGGSALACELLAKALLNHTGIVRVFIPQYAFSAGTMIALAADEIYMTKNAVLGPVDPQAMDFPVNSILDSINENIDKKGFISTFMKSYVGKIKEDYDRTLRKVLQVRFGDNFNEKLMDHFNENHHHGYPIDVTELGEIGIDINLITVKWREQKKIFPITECEIRGIEVANEVEEAQVAD